MRRRRTRAVQPFLVCALLLPAQETAACPGGSGAGSSAQAAAAAGDGQRDFDFELGTWKTHVRRRERPLSGSESWVEYEGTSVVRELLDGRANIVEL